ncbi:MAG: ferrochelatase [Burkholderiales bacterium]|nr:MAG: ferrochelatase [Burkholderiales bacterium]
MAFRAAKRENNFVSQPVFFEAERKRFFRPLNSSRRELVVACLRALYERLHGPAADYAHTMTRDSLRELLMAVVRDNPDRLTIEAEPDEFSRADGEPLQLTNLLMRALLADGWLEQFADRHGLVTAFRFSRPGKLFAEVLWTLDRPSRSRQRNMRGCRNALDAALQPRGDAHDLVDAYEYAEKVIEDLTEGIDYFQELVRHLMQTASVQRQWSEFVEFLDRFQREYSKQLTADNAMLNRQAIRQNLERLRQVNDTKFRRMDEQLHDIAHWAVKEHSGTTVYEWLLSRIEDIVDAACETKQPGFLKAMETYLKRVNGLAMQSLMLRAGQTRHAYLQGIQRVAQAGDREAQDRLLLHYGAHLANAEVRLLDPASFKLRTATQRRRAVTVTIRPRTTREERLAAALARAESEAFSLPNELVAEGLRADLRIFRHSVRLSALPTESAEDVLKAMQAVEAARSSGGDFLVRRLPTRLDNPAYSGSDYEIDLKK